MTRGAVRAVEVEPEPSALEQAEATLTAEQAALDVLRHRRVEIEQQLARAQATFRQNPDDREAALDRMIAQQKIENTDEGIAAQQKAVDSALANAWEARWRHHGALAAGAVEAAKPLCQRQLELLTALVDLCVEQHALMVKGRTEDIRALSARAEMHQARGEPPSSLNSMFTGGGFLSLRRAAEWLQANARGLSEGDPRRKPAFWIAEALIGAAQERGL